MHTPRRSKLSCIWGGRWIGPSRRAGRRPCLLALLSLFLAYPGATSNATERTSPNQLLSPSEYRQRLNDSLVTVMAGPLDGTGLSIADDLAEVLDGDSLRVVPIVGKGVAQNVRDLRFMRGVDLGITHTNILKHFARTGEIGPSLENQITYIAKLFNEEVHLVVRSETTRITELSGHRVSFGEKGSGADITAELILEALNINVDAVHLSDAEAIMKLKSGAIAAAVVVGGKPAPLFNGNSDIAGLKLLTIPYTAELQDDYYPAELTHDDYPLLIAEGGSVDTVAVCAVLVTFNWPKKNERYRKVAKFVDAFFNKFEEFHRPPRHPKWRDVNFAATLEGWQRSPIAQQWIDRKKEGAGVVSRKTFDDFMQQAVQIGEGSLSASERADLFRDFVEWNKTQSGSQGTDQTKDWSARGPYR